MRLAHLPLGLALLAATSPLAAQDRGAAEDERVFVTGRIVDQSTGRALRLARVALVAPGPEGGEGVVVWTGLTRNTGQFEAPDIPAGSYELRVSLLSFRDLTHEADLREGLTRDFQIALVPAALELEPIVAVAHRRTRMEMSGFFERKEEGIGVLLDRKDIQERTSSSRVSDVLQTVAGVRVYPPLRPGQPPQIRLRDDCVPQIVVDGSPFSGPVDIDQIVQTHDLEAIEVHSGMSSPVRYDSFSCGTIIAWTRQLEPGEGRPLTLARVVGAAGLVSLVLLVSR